MRTHCAVVIVLFLFAAPVFAAGPYYARGDFYAGSQGLWSFDGGNILYDDGQHDDGIAGDGIHGGWVVTDQPAGWHDFKVANADWSENWPHHPYRPTDNARVWTTGPGDMIHFRLDLNARYDWQPAQGVATDHYAPPGTIFELIGGDPETGAWTGPGIPLVEEGGLWTAQITYADEGIHLFRYRAQGTWEICQFGWTYNMSSTDPVDGAFSVRTTGPDQEVRFRFDPVAGQAHAQFVSMGGTRFYARGDYYAGTNGLWNFDTGNELFDDGQHGDGAAGDGVYGAYVVSDQPPGRHEFKIANADYTLNWPHDPANPTVNAQLWTTLPAEVVHFRLDTNVVGNGWQPPQYAVATDHFAPPGTVFEVMGGDPETGNWFGTPLAAVQLGSLWRAMTTIAAVGFHEFKFRAAGRWDLCNFGRDYNLPTGLSFDFVTSHPDTEIVFELDTATGRGRAVLAGPTAVQPMTWGALKSRFR
jgi:hypothetical protein